MIKRENMTNRLKLTTMVVCVCVGLLSATMIAGASGVINFVGANRSVVVDSRQGPSYDRSVVGQYGYKVFNPGAIVVDSVNVELIPSKPGAETFSAVSTGTRNSNTDAWLSLTFSWDWKEWGWGHRSSHVSDSSIHENQIWSDGYLKKTADHGWRETCTKHTEGSYAVCSNEFFDLIPYNIEATGKHYYQTDGYTDTSRTTTDSHN